MHAIVTLTLLVPVTVASKQGAYGDVVLSGHAGTHWFRVYLQDRPFRRAGRRVVRGLDVPAFAEQVYQHTSVDGRIAWGCRPFAPKRELCRMLVVIDGVVAVLPEWAWNDLYETNLPWFPPSKAATKIGRDGVLRIEITGSDGPEAGYRVRWIVRPNGDYTRTIEFLEQIADMQSGFWLRTKEPWRKAWAGRVTPAKR
jgi:hypothetical protein